MKEVEILVEIFEDKDKALEKLGKFDFKGDKKVADLYFDTGSKDTWIRIRASGNQAYLAFKKDYFKDGAWLYSDEHETEIDNADEAKKILSEIGFKELVCINNIKHSFESEKYQIVLEEVEQLGLFLEVEGKQVGDQEDISAVKSEIQRFINKLKIKVSSELKYGKPELMLQKINSTNE